MLNPLSLTGLLGNVVYGFGILQPLFFCVVFDVDVDFCPIGSF